MSQLALWQSGVLYALRASGSQFLFAFPVEQLNVSRWPAQLVPAPFSSGSGRVRWWEETGRSCQDPPKAAGWAGCGFWYMGVLEVGPTSRRRLFSV